MIVFCNVQQFLEPSVGYNQSWHTTPNLDDNLWTSAVDVNT